MLGGGSKALRGKRKISTAKALAKFIKRVRRNWKRRLPFIFILCTCACLAFWVVLVFLHTATPKLDDALTSPSNMLFSPAATASPRSATSALLRIFPELSSKDFRSAQAEVLGNVSKGIKLTALVAARYTDELIIWTDKEEKRSELAASALRYYAAAADVSPEEVMVPYRQAALHYFQGNCEKSLQDLGAAIPLAEASLWKTAAGNKAAEMESKTLWARRVLARSYFFAGVCSLQLGGGDLGLAGREAEAIGKGAGGTQMKRAALMLENALRFDAALAEAHRQLARIRLAFFGSHFRVQ